MMMLDSLRLTFHSIRFCKFIPTEADEFSVLVHHAVIDNDKSFVPAKIPFYINLKKNLSVKEFRDKVIGCVNIADKEEFLKAKLEVSLKNKCQSSELFLLNDDDQITGLSDNSIIYIIYN